LFLIIQLKQRQELELKSQPKIDIKRLHELEYEVQNINKAVHRRATEADLLELRNHFQVFPSNCLEINLNLIETKSLPKLTNSSQISLRK
jgi:hypothetical protein